MLLLRSRLRVKQHKVNQETRKWASYKDAVRERCHSFHFVLKTPVSIVFLAIKSSQRKKFEVTLLVSNYTSNKRDTQKHLHIL